MDETTPEPLLQFFEEDVDAEVRFQLLQEQFKMMALEIVTSCSPSDERRVALRKLLESRDAAMRCVRPSPPPL